MLFNEFSRKFLQYICKAYFKEILYYYAILFIILCSELLCIALYVFIAGVCNIGPLGQVVDW